MTFSTRCASFPDFEAIESVPNRHSTPRWRGARSLASPVRKMTPTVAFVGGLKIGDVAKHAVFESLCQLGEEAFEGVKPGARGMREMKRPARVASEPRTFSCLWVIRQLENAPAMRRQQMIAPDFLHRGDRKPAAFRDGLSSPIGGFMRRRFQGQRNHPLNARAQLVRRRAAGFCRGEARPRLQ